MKIALCFAGQLRFVNEYSKYIIDNIIKLHDVDVYGHFWWDESMLNKPFHHEFNDLYKENIEDFKKIYSPKKLVYEDKFKKNNSICLPKCVERDMSLTQEQCEKAIFNMKSQFYSVQQCYKLIENPSQYDFIIRIRSDCYIKSPLILDAVNKDTLYIQNGYCAGRDRRFCDWFALGNHTVMEKYCDTYNYIDTYYINGVIHMHKFIENVVNDFNVNVVDYEFNVPINHSYYNIRK
jgi:hypothetical protein